MLTNGTETLVPEGDEFKGYVLNVLKSFQNSRSCDIFRHEHFKLSRKSCQDLNLKAMFYFQLVPNLVYGWKPSVLRIYLPYCL